LKHPKLIDAVFFDMDGVLVDSMKYHVEAWVKAFNENGFYPKELPFYLNEGVRHDITVKDRLAELGVENASDELIEKIYSRKREIYEKIAVLKPLNGIEAILDRLKGKVIMAVVTGGVPPVVKKTLSLFECRFDFVVDYESTKKGKPDPEPYLFAAAKAGVPRDRILVIENSPTGIASAVGAGLACWAVCTTLPAEYLKRADRVFDDFRQLECALFDESVILLGNAIT